MVRSWVSGVSGSIVLAALAACSGRDPGAEAAHTSAGRATWHEDLRVLATELPRRHPNAFFRSSEIVWRVNVAALDTRLDALDDDHVVVELRRLVASIGDAHTNLARSHDRRYPIRILSFDDGLFIGGAPPDAAWAVGTKLVAIDHHPIADAVAAVTPLVANENESELQVAIPELLGDATILSGAGLAAPATATFTLAAPDGTTHELALAPGEPVPVQPPAKPPLHLQGPPRLGYWYTHDEPDRLLYLQYNQCADDPRAGPFADFAANALAYVDAHPVDRFVIDLRSNGGGDSQVLQPLIDGLASRPALAHRVFVLIGRGTFSSAMLNAIQMSTRLGAKLVGYPTGGNPNGYGEVKTLRLPHSGLIVHHSTRLFTQSHYGHTVPPDLPVHVTSADWFGGKDPYLDAVLAAQVP
jgi:hypothetical protein